MSRERESVKTVDAFWERRNLGVTCFEVAAETTDTETEVKNGLERLVAQYLVVKVPVGRPDLMSCLSEMDFRFIEANIHVTRTIDNLELSGIQKRLAGSVSYAPMQEGDMQVLLDELGNGMHDSDRVYLDPHFTKEQSANRYSSWIQDEVARGADVYKLILKGQSIGYFALKHLGGGIYDPFLAGMYRSHRNIGLGFNIVYKPMCEIAARGGRSVSTHISTNNESIVRTYVSMGFQFDKITYVYIKHNDA
jgi:hypothetical protein